MNWEEETMGIVVIGAVFVDVKGYPESNYIPAGRNAISTNNVHIKTDDTFFIGDSSLQSAEW